MRTNVAGFGAWGQIIRTKPSEPSQDEIEQAYREGYVQGYRKDRKACDKFLSNHSRVRIAIGVRLTDKKIANDLKDNCEGLMAVKVSPDIDALRYIKLAAFEDAMEGDG